MVTLNERFRYFTENKNEWKKNYSKLLTIVRIFKIIQTVNKRKTIAFYRTDEIKRKMNEHSENKRIKKNMNLI